MQFQTMSSYIKVCVLLVVCGRTFVEGLTCLNCESAMNPLFCEHTIECMSGSICSIEKFESSGNTLYKLGCLSKTRCPRTRSLAFEDIEQCIQCCTTNGCNKEGCGSTNNHIQTGPLCYNCVGITDPLRCNQARVCETDEICFIQEILRFNQRFFKTSCENRHVCQALTGNFPVVGRKKRKATIEKRSTLCSKCCPDDLCNNHCTTATAISTTTTQGSTATFQSTIRNTTTRPTNTTTRPTSTTITLPTNTTNRPKSTTFKPTTTTNTMTVQQYTECGGNLSTLTGTFSSPLFPNPYPSYSSCIYHIHVKPGYKIDILFNAFQTERGNDYVQVYDGQKKTSSNLVATYSGNHSDNTIHVLSTDNEMLVYFRSDQTTELTGFRASYIVYNDSCFNNLTASSGSFGSPNYPREYTNYLYCKYAIQVQAGQTITVTFHSFSTERKYDIIQVFDGLNLSDKLLLVFSGIRSNNWTVNSTSNSMLLLFTTDHSATHSGFSATYNSH